MRKFLAPAFALAVLVLAGCASAGKVFDTTHANEVKNGMPKSQIRTWFGEPHQVARLQPSASGCVVQWLYVHARATHAGMKTSSESLAVHFDSAEKVCDSAFVRN